MKTILLTQGQRAIVDDEDFPLLSTQKWFAHKGKQSHLWYARRQTPRPGQKTILMHRVLLLAKKGEVIDHKNGNGLDNRRANLRFCTRSEQSLNCRASSKHGFRGINFSSKSREGNRWYAHVRVRGKWIALGSYGTAEEAARAFDRLAPKYMGTLYRPNFPHGG